MPLLSLMGFEEGARGNHDAWETTTFSFINFINKMQKKYSYLMLALLLSMLWLPMQLMAQDGNTVLQPQFGKQTVTVATDQELTYYDYKGTGSIMSSNSSNSHSLLVFKPAEQGYSIMITFESFDVRTQMGSYQGYAKVYDGEVDDTGFTWATKINEVTKDTKLPEGNVIETLDGIYTDKKSFYSTTTDGALSVGFIYRYSFKADGWVAKVKCVKLENMSVTDAGSQYDNVKKPEMTTDVNIAGLYVNASGVLNADHLTAIKFRMAENENVVDPLSLKLFAGSADSYKGATPIATTITEDNGIYTMTLDHKLSEGKNEFTIVGDLNTEASIGAKLKLEVTGVTTTNQPGGVATFTAAEAVGLVNPAIVTFPAEYKTITVTDTPLNFYDDGGPTEMVTIGFNGMVTFKPASPDKKVMINFSKMNIFESSLHDDAKSQYILIYNGSTDDEANLIRTVRETETPFVRSNSEDGALTIKFVSGSELSYTRDGFEAEVSLFIPQPMTTQAVETTQASAKTLAAGDTDQEILKLNVKTENNYPALTAKKFSFTTNGTNDIISKATVYYTKSAASFSTSVKVGEAEVTGDAIEITATDEVSLVEGDNYFWLAYDIKETAVNGQKIDAAVTSVTLSDATHTVADGNPEGNREVLNQVVSHSDQGTVTKKVNGSMGFKTQNKNEYSSDYESGTDDRINIFLPYNEGMICQIEFSKFDLYWNTYSSSEHASLKIYSGKGTTGELLWETTKNNYTKGPEGVIRSTAADGALTVVFNAGVTSSWNTKNGFVATVSEYLSKPMEVAATTATQSAKEIAKVGEKDLDILNINITTEGNENPKKLSAVTVDMKGAEKSIAAIKLYSLAKADEEIAADKAPVATATIDGTATEATLTLDEPLALAEGDNHFRLRYDISDDAKAGDIIDAAIKSITADGETLTTENGDPEGAVMIKNIYNMMAGDNGEILINEGAPLLFYDDGGVDGDYSKNFEGTVTFAPKTPGQSVKLTFKEWTVTAQDKFYVYHGGEVKEKEDAKYSMYDKPTYFLSDAEDGKVTVKFVTKYSKAGFAIEVTAYEKQPISVASVTTTAVAPETTMKGAETLLQKIEVVADGDLNVLDIQKFNLAAIDLADNALANAKIYATGTSAEFAPVDLFGKQEGGQLSINGSYKITLPGTYYFWLAGDISTEAAPEATACAQLESITANETTTNVEEAAAASTKVVQGVSGTITVGAGADYGTIQAAVNSLKDGIDGPVTINIKRGIYNENVTVPEIPGASENNTVTLQSESGDWHDVKIYYDLYNEPQYSDDKMFNEFGTFTIAGADWFTLRGVEVTTTDTNFPGVIHIKNQSRHVTIDNCYIHADMTVTYSEDINLIYTYTKNLAYQNNDYLTVKNCLLEGGYIGVRMGGTSYVALPKEVGGVIENNILRNQGSKSLYVSDELGTKIRNNRIENNATTKEFDGIDAQVRDLYDESFEISGNKFHLNTNNSALAITLRQMTGSEEVPVNIVNNEVIVVSNSEKSYGIKVGNNASNVNIANNSVNMLGEAKSSAMVISSSTAENLKVVNNVLMNNAGGYVYSYNNADYMTKASYANNAGFTTGEVFARHKEDVASYEAWLAICNEENGVNEAANFIDGENTLELSKAGNLMKALPLAYVETDITGKERNGETPTIGAYEFDANTDAPVMVEGYPIINNITDTSADMKVRFSQTGAVQYMVKDGAEDAPTVDEITTSENVITAYKNDETKITVEGLEKDKEYVIYSLMTNINGVSSEVYASSKFIAGGEVIKEIPNVKATAEATESVESGQKASLKVNVTEGTAPFSISWTNGMLQEIATASLDDFGISVVEYAPVECDMYYVTVTDANGKQASDTCRVAVTGDAVVATFENLYLDSESYWNGPDSKGTPMVGIYGDNQLDGSFVSGSYQFSNNYSLDWNSWQGFAYSNRTATTFTSATPDQYNSVVGHGYDESENYAVVFDKGTITVLNKPEEGDVINGFYITNNAWALDCIKNGNGVAHKFEEGDYLIATFTGTRADGSTSTVDCYLADYRASKEADRYYLDTWQWVDLRPLGKVKTISVSLSGSDTGSFGLNTSAYFCMDDFNGERVIAEAPVQVAGDEIDLSEFFTFDDASATVSYAFADALSEELAQNVTLSADGRLTVKKGYYNSFNVVVSATQKGKIQFLNIPFDIVDGINGVEDSSSNVAGRYNISGQKLNALQKGVNIIRTTNGKTVKVGVR